MNIQEEQVAQYLCERVEKAAWRIDHPQQGFSFGARFFGSTSRRKVFIKLGVDYRIVAHLAARGLTPRYLAGGVFADTTITVQEFVEGVHPDQQWYEENQDTVGRLLRTLQLDNALRSYLPPVQDETFKGVLTGYVELARELYEQQTTSIDRQKRAIIEGLLAHYQQRLPCIEGAGLVPVHGDPNPGNMLVTPTTTYLLDWDAIHLSDPMHDIMQVLWWSYPRSQWGKMFELFEIDLRDGKQRERFYLSISIRALYVALFFSNIQHERFAGQFLSDAQRALEEQEPLALLIARSS